MVWKNEPFSGPLFGEKWTISGRKWTIFREKMNHFPGEMNHFREKMDIFPGENEPFSRTILPDHFSGGALSAHDGQEPRLDRSPDATGQALGPS